MPSLEIQSPDVLKKFSQLDFGDKSEACYWLVARLDAQRGRGSSPRELQGLFDYQNPDSKDIIEELELDINVAWEVEFGERL